MMTMQRRAVSVATLMVLASSAWADEVVQEPGTSPEQRTELNAKEVQIEKPNWLGTYLVGQFGEAKGRIDSQPGNDKSLSYRAGAGYRVNDYLALEASFVDAGRYRAGTTNLKAYGAAVGVQAKLPLSAVYGPLDDNPAHQSDILARTALYVRGEAVALRVSPAGLPSANSVAPGWAVGIEYGLDRGLVVRGEYQRIAVDYDKAGVDESATLDVLSVGVSKSLSY